MATQVIFLTAGSTTWTVPSDWNNSNNTIDLIGAGGGGHSSTGAAGAGGGDRYRPSQGGGAASARPGQRAGGGQSLQVRVSRQHVA